MLPTKQESVPASHHSALNCVLQISQNLIQELQIIFRERILSAYIFICQTHTGLPVPGSAQEHHRIVNHEWHWSTIYRPHFTQWFVCIINNTQRQLAFQKFPRWEMSQRRIHGLDGFSAARWSNHPPFNSSFPLARPKDIWMIQHCFHAKPIQREWMMCCYLSSCLPLPLSLSHTLSPLFQY